MNQKRQLRLFRFACLASVPFSLGVVVFLFQTVGHELPWLRPVLVWVAVFDVGLALLFFRFLGVVLQAKEGAELVDLANAFRAFDGARILAVAEESFTPELYREYRSSRRLLLVFGTVGMVVMAGVVIWSRAAFLGAGPGTESF